MAYDVPVSKDAGYLIVSDVIDPSGEGVEAYLRRTMDKAHRRELNAVVLEQSHIVCDFCRGWEITPCRDGWSGVLGSQITSIELRQDSIAKRVPGLIQNLRDVEYVHVLQHAFHTAYFDYWEERRMAARNRLRRLGWIFHRAMNKWLLPVPGKMLLMGCMFGMFLIFENEGNFMQYAEEFFFYHQDDQLPFVGLVQSE